MLPTRSQIDEYAAGRTRRRGKLIITPEDFTEACWQLLLDLNYELFIKYPLRGSKQWLGRRPQKTCRYCLKSRPETTFKSKSHAVPECLGNESILSVDECDLCNELFSQTFEDHMDKFTQGLRTMLGITGKSGVPTYRTRDKSGRIEHDHRLRHLRIIEGTGSRFVEDDERNRRLSVKLMSHPYIPIEVYRCLTKTAFAILPVGELEYFESCRQWLLERNSASLLGHTSLARVHLALYPSPSSEPLVCLWRRTSNWTQTPYMLAAVSTVRFILMFALPLSTRDERLTESHFTVPRIDLTLHPAGVGATWQTVDFRSDQRENSLVQAFILTYDNII
jgi:hypothetical protein